MAAIVSIDDRCGLRIEVHHTNQPNDWFLEFDLVHDIFACVCVSAIEATNN